MIALPAALEAVFNEFRTCECTTLARDGTPLTWPITALFEAETRRFLLTTSIGFPHKALNIRRDRRISLLYSNPTGSGLLNPPAVLVQGEARAAETVEVSPDADEDLRKCWLHIMRFQPFSPLYSNNPLSHFMCDWYFMRLLIAVTPRRICWWERGDFTQAAHEVELNDVG
jgi:Pyridoxamine 5'-phosphate oxidase